MKLAVVIVNYNSKDFLSCCLKSLYRETRQTAFETVVVDNASSDRDFSALESSYPRLRFILNRQNLGFSTACNQAIRSADADFYLLINPDCLVEESAVDRCVDYLVNHPDVGILGCRVNNPDGTLQRACRRRIPTPSIALYRLSGLSRFFPRSRRFGAYDFGAVEDDQPHEVEAVSGSFLMFRREVLTTSGFLDEEFFLYGEDLDFCYRAGLAGWKILYYPLARVIHVKRGSSSRNVDAATFHFYDAMRIFYRKHFHAQASPIERTLVYASIGGLHLGRRLLNSLRRRRTVGSEG